MAESEDIETTEEGAPPKRSRKPLLMGVALALLLGGGGFFATFSGMVALPFGGGEDKGAGAKSAAKAPPVSPDSLPAFVPVGEMVIPLGPNARAKFLVIEMEIETRPEDAAAFEALKPRILDVVNTYLRAIEEADIEAPGATLRLRAQLLRRVRAVSAPAEPRDLLITAFVLK